MRPADLTDYQIKALAMARDRKQGREPSKAKLASHGYLVKVRGGYVITDKGRGGYVITDKGRAVLQLCEK